MIECRLQRFERNYLKQEKKAPARYGMYSSCFVHSVKGYGKKRWVVYVYIDLDYESAKKNGFSDEEIIHACIEYLNTPQKSKYGKKRKRKLPYGKFESTPHRFKFKEKNDKTYIEAQLIVSSPESKIFWSSGPRL